MDLRIVRVVVEVLLNHVCREYHAHAYLAKWEARAPSIHLCCHAWYNG